MSEHLYRNIRLPEPLERVNKKEHAYLLPYLIKHLSDGILFITLEGEISLINPSALHMFKSKGASLGRYWDLFPDDFFGFSMKESLKFGISYRLLYKSWEEKEWEISTTFVYEGSPKEQGLIVFCRDITDIKQFQRAALRNEKIKDLGAMTASIAHEIRNPLGGIRGFAMLLYRDLFSQPHLQEMAASIIEGTKTLERLVNQVLHYARPIPAQLRSVEICQFLKQLGKFIRVDPDFPQRVDFHVHVPQDPLLVPLDPDLLRSALLNLVFNALQAMPEGGVLTLSLLKEEARCQIALSDTGMGMSEEQLNSLFTPFFTTKQKGNGLGLVETEKIIDAHGGTIEVRSSLGKGSTFVITLPLSIGGLKRGPL